MNPGEDKALSPGEYTALGPGEGLSYNLYFSLLFQLYFTVNPYIASPFFVRKGPGLVCWSHVVWFGSVG